MAEVTHLKPNPPTEPAYPRILLKLSGEALMGPDAFGIHRLNLGGRCRNLGRRSIGRPQPLKFFS